MKQFGLIGLKLEHSFSKNYFSEKFIKEQLIDCIYDNYSLENIGGFKDLICRIHFTGLNVTIPYKEQIIPYLTSLDEEAEKIGAVNCIKFYPDKGSVGFNTDHYGFQKSIMPFLRSHHTDALILGDGGAAKAVAFVLKKLGINYRFVTRNVKDNSAENFSYKELNETIIRHFKFIINTTPLGTYPRTEEHPIIPYASVSEEHFLYDLIYNPSETIFLKKGRKAGAEIQNGLSMLQHQAEKSWEIWNSPDL